MKSARNPPMPMKMTGQNFGSFIRLIGELGHGHTKESAKAEVDEPDETGKDAGPASNEISDAEESQMLGVDDLLLFRSVHHKPPCRGQRNLTVLVDNPNRIAFKIVEATIPELSFLVE